MHNILLLHAHRSSTCTPVFLFLFAVLAGDQLLWTEHRTLLRSILTTVHTQYSHLFSTLTTGGATMPLVCRGAQSLIVGGGRRSIRLHFDLTRARDAHIILQLDRCIERAVFTRPPSSSTLPAKSPFSPPPPPPSCACQGYNKRATLLYTERRFRESIEECRVALSLQVGEDSVDNVGAGRQWVRVDSGCG